MSDTTSQLSRLRAETDAKLLRDARRQFAWPDVLFIVPASVFILWMEPGRVGGEALVTLALLTVIWRVSARLDAAVTLLQRQLPKA
jgi:hypothetical protein